MTRTDRTHVKALMPHRINGQTALELMDLEWGMAMGMVASGVLVEASEGLYVLASAKEQV